MDPALSFAQALELRAAEHPDRIAVRVARGAAPSFLDLTYGELAERAASIAAGLEAAGLKPKDRVLLFVRPGLDLIAVTYALLHLGAVPVLIDPGMGRKKLLASVSKMSAAAMIGVGRAHLARWLFPRAFGTVRLWVHVGPGPSFSAQRLASLEALGRAKRRRAYSPRHEDAAAVLFTSGSTGPPKGVLATHGGLAAQLSALELLYGLGPGGVNLACFPLFALFDTALGMTSVFPEIDPTAPARAHPARIVDAIRAAGATVAFGSPAIWRRVVPWCQGNGQSLAPLRTVLIAGAPVPPALMETLRPLLGEGGEAFTPYGATECLPVSSVSGEELLATRARAEGGLGTCIGREAPGVELRLVAPRVSGSLSELDLEDVPEGEVGEVLVRAPQASPLYVFDEPATQRAKVQCSGSERPGFWHRMGDLARRDENGRLWFQGRLAEALHTTGGLVPTTPIETAADQYPGVHRTALVGVGPLGQQVPVLVVEPSNGMPRGDRAERFRKGLCSHLAERVPHLVQPAHVLFHPRFPVDVRHNAKIHRLTLGAWAAEQLGRAAASAGAPLARA